MRWPLRWLLPPWNKAMAERDPFDHGFLCGWTAAWRAARGLCPCVDCARIDAQAPGECLAVQAARKAERPS